MRNLKKKSVFICFFNLAGSKIGELVDWLTGQLVKSDFCRRQKLGAETSTSAHFDFFAAGKNEVCPSVEDASLLETPDGSLG